MKRPSKIVAKMRRQRKGSLHKVWEYLDQLDRDFLQAYNEVAVLNFNLGAHAKGRALSAKFKELVAVALLASIRGDTTRDHIRKALSLGASKREVVEALEMSMLVTGAPSLLFGLTQLMALESESKK